MFVFKTAVVGAGTMGGEIAQTLAAADLPVVLKDVDQKFVDLGLEKARQVTQGQLSGLVKKEKITQEQADQKLEYTLGLISGTTEYEGFGDVDFVVEAVPERMEIKTQVFADLDASTPGHAILASNTSSCNVTALAAATKRPAQVLGMHFFNPVPLMKLVEVVRTILTDDNAVTTATEWVKTLGKVPVQAKDSTAFIVNRLLVPYLLDAIRVYEGGLATLEDIDQAMKLGCGYPMGPFTLLDLVGLDTTMYVAEVMFDEFREPRYAPPPLLKRMVMAGQLGRKTGKGFYRYSA